MDTAVQTTEILSFTPQFHELTVARSSIERGLGYRHAKVSAAVHSAIDEVLPLVPNYLDLRCGFVVLRPESVTVKNEAAMCDSRYLHLGPVIAARLRVARTLTVFVATAGPRLERWASELMQDDDVIKGYIVDAIASETRTDGRLAGAEGRRSSGAARVAHHKPVQSRLLWLANIRPATPLFTSSQRFLRDQTHGEHIDDSDKIGERRDRPGSECSS